MGTKRTKFLFGSIGLLLFVAVMGFALFGGGTVQTAYAWACGPSGYHFTFTFNGNGAATVTAVNSSNSNEPAQQVKVYLDGSSTPFATLSVPALAKNTSSVLTPQLTGLPTGTHTVLMDGTADCDGTGSYTYTPRTNTASVVIDPDCQAWSISIIASHNDYTVSGATSGLWNGAWSVNYSITVNFPSGTPASFPFSGTITRAEECQQNTAGVTPAVTCEGWSLTINASSADYTVSGATSGLWNGAWSVNYSITLTFAHGVPTQLPFTGTLTRAQECQQNTASVTPAVTCEGWSLTITASPGYTVTGATSGVWGGAWSANYSVQLTYANGVPPQFTFTGTVNRPQECQQNFADVSTTANCTTWELIILASEGVSVQSGATAGVWQPGEWSVNYSIVLAFANGVPQTLSFSGTILRPAECQQNSATFTPSTTCEGWSVAVVASDGGSVSGTTSGGWDVNGQAVVNLVVNFAHGTPLQVFYNNVLNKPTESCLTPTPEVTPTDDPTPTPEGTPSPTPEGTPTPPPTPQPPPPTYCFIPGSETWPVDVSLLNVYGNLMVSRDQNTGVINIHSLDAEVFIPGTRIPLTFGDQTIYVWVTFDGIHTCAPDPISNPAPVATALPCPDCQAYVCEGFRTDGAEVVTFPLPGYVNSYALIARDVALELPGALVNTVHGNTYQIFWHITADERDALLAALAGAATVTPYGMPCSACIEEWGRWENGSVFYAIGVTEYEVFLAWLFGRDGTDPTLRSEAQSVAHRAAVEFHAAQADGVLDPFVVVPPAA